MFSRAIRITFESNHYRIFAVLSFTLSLAFYLMILPASFTGGRIGFAAMRYLDTERVIFSIIMAALMALLLPMLFFQLRRGQRTNKASAAGGVAVGVMAPLLCCSPALPIALGFVATLFPSLMGAMAWQLQGFIATHQFELFTAASILLAVAVYQNARSIVRGPSCELPGQRRQSSVDVANGEAVSSEGPSLVSKG